MTLDTNVFTRSICAACTLSITNPAASDFAPRAVTGVYQTTTADLVPFSVSDETGTGAGSRHRRGQHLLRCRPHPAASSLLMSQPSVAANGNASPVPTS